MRVPARSLLWLLVPVLLCAGCGDASPRTPAAAQQAYGTAVDAAEALPAPAVAAEPARYDGRRLTVDGRIGRVSDDGCRFILDTKGDPPLHVEAPRSSPNCAWSLAPSTDGIAVAAGTLRTVGDSLRLSASGVQVTPTQGPASGS